MTENNIRHLPVVDENNKLINFLSQRDLIVIPSKIINQVIILGFFILILTTIFMIK
jgi:CBS-domain-containing membrane protein